MSAPEDWRRERERLTRTIEELRRQGICYQCHDFATGEVFPDEPVVYEDALFKVVLEQYPRMRGHTLVVYKPHREDISYLTDEESSRVFAMSVKVAKAIKVALGAEKVYLNTMCDGGINHLHIQLFPRYAGDPSGSKRFGAERHPLTGGVETAQRLRSALMGTTV